uniref:Secreted protein n=1 Tax=Triticum urartu TaxID=4572 RepID=A0A8R7UCT1_TRIUA
MFPFPKIVCIFRIVEFLQILFSISKSVCCFIQPSCFFLKNNVSQKCSHFQICLEFFKIVLYFKICSQETKNVRALQNCSCFQICSGFFKIVFRFKICSQGSKNVRASKNNPRFQICSQDSKIVHAS